MVTIQKGTTPLTLINVFHVRPEQQQALADLLVEATEKAMSHQPGFISASIHKSYDGTRVVNYAQWRSQADYDAIMHVDDALVHMKQAAGLAESYDPILCEVVESTSVESEPAA